MRGPDFDIRTTGDESLSREAGIILRDRLSSILGFAELLAEDSKITPRSRGYARNILISGEQLLLALGRAPAGRATVTGLLTERVK